ncbi:unnamed protein product (macronuclear) [Paramecium tetraurelia]|uniref:Beta'-coat protein n=1 Tax=Paramecium tetraurelia TaxID=5888 RepID=A0DZB4_PARTE|nr:uncharacterized protein GSPATT00003350001 [Paramecium tetraurelia]CAK88381.1 unnamed protein product [Paramecium tetraurelia]|eukprot:XP_001455778.1 hypothetical protein (macronuclear) [Paramecium tetraurelia strain d4-2]
MSLNFEIKKKHVARSERVKSVELHSEYTWVLSGLYSGVITIQDYSNQVYELFNQTIVKQIDQKQNEVNRQAFEAHTDYIRCVIVHPSQPYLITSSDDTTIKLWDIDNNFTLLRTFEDHVNYVMMVAYNPRDPNTFASASMDNTVKVWTIRIANLISHLISDGDDRSIKIWDCQTKQCIHTLEAHQQNISSAKFHTDLPLIISQLLKTESLDSGIQIRTNQKHHSIIIWKEFGVQIQEKIIHQPFLTMKEHQPIVSMQQGKVVDGKNFQFFTINLKAINNTSNDGQIIQTNSKELGISDIYPCGVRHSPNGHLFAIFSDSEYTIYSSQNFKNSGFGSGTDLIWSSNGDYAVRKYFLQNYLRTTL